MARTIILTLLLSILTACQSTSTKLERVKAMEKSQYDVLIVGGSHAGLNAAMAIGRLRRSALIVDAGKPRNEAAKYANNIAGSDGIDPDKLRSQARKDLKKYKTIKSVTGIVTSVTKQGPLFEAKLDSGEKIQARKVILAYGVKNILPNIQGIWNLWAKSVFHCPYCHGFEVKDQTIGMIDSGKTAEHVLPLLKNLSKKLVLFTNGKPDLSPEFEEKMKAHGIPIYEEHILSLDSEDSKLKSVVFSNGRKIKVEAILVNPKIPFEMNSTISEYLGCEKDHLGLIKVNDVGKTSVDGVFAAGDIMTMQQSIVGAAASGQAAGSGAIFELSHEDFNSNKDQK